MKKNLIVAGLLLLLAATQVSAAVVYRETFDYTDSIANITGRSWITNAFNWYAFYTKSNLVFQVPTTGGPNAPIHREWFQAGNSTVDAVQPEPTANSLPVSAYPQPGCYLTHTDVSIQSRYFFSTTTAYFTGDQATATDSLLAAEYKPDFHSIQSIEWDMKVANATDTVHVLIFAGGHWYASGDEIVFAAANTWQRVSIDWTTTTWYQLDDNRAHWSNNTMPTNNPLTDTSVLGTVDTFGLINYQCRGVWDVDNIALNGVPEPATMSLLGLGVLGILRRK
jgi:hypothetical protein